MTKNTKIQLIVGQWNLDKDNGNLKSTISQIENFLIKKIVDKIFYNFY